MAIDIVPALLVRSVRDLESGLQSLRGVTRFVQVDFVNQNFLRDEESFPLWEEFDFEVDLMLPHPKAEVEAMVALGAARIVVHAASEGAKEAVELLQGTRGGDYPVEVGVALKSHDTLEALAPFEAMYDYVQVMGIDREGAQGEPPDPHHKELELIRALRAAYPNLLIQVDGAAAAHVKELLDAGASRLVVGGAIVGAENPKAAYKQLYTEANAQ